MAGRIFRKPLGCLEVDVVTLFGNVSIGAAGAPTLNTNPGSKGIKSITRNSAGNYTVQLEDYYAAILYVDLDVLATTDNPTTAGVQYRLISFNNFGANPAALPSVVIQFQSTADGSAIDPGNGATVLLKVDLRNSSVI